MTQEAERGQILKTLVVKGVKTLVPDCCDTTGFCEGCKEKTYIPCLSAVRKAGAQSRIASTVTPIRAPAVPAPKQGADFRMLHDILSMMRPYGSVTEQRFVDKYLKPLGVAEDDFGNGVLRVGTDPVLWSCHTDTVHLSGGIAPIRVNDEKGVVDVHPKSQANCLVADDGAGAWIMIQMILAKKSGLYVFHRGEECGGRGSRYIANYTPELLDDIQFAIAFDRKGKDSIITHQQGGRCCSEDFSRSLEAELGMGMKSDRLGSFTDTASYTGLVGECTNLSVGYLAQHSRSEDLDQNFLAWLLERILMLDVGKLTAKRLPGEKEATYSYENEYWWPRRNAGSSAKRHDKRTAKVDKEPRKHTRGTSEALYRWRSGRVIQETHLALVEDYPEEIAKMLAESNYSLEWLRSIIRKHGGRIPDGIDEAGGVH